MRARPLLSGRSLVDERAAPGFPRKAITKAGIAPESVDFLTTSLPAILEGYLRLGGKGGRCAVSPWGNESAPGPRAVTGSGSESVPYGNENLVKNGETGAAG
jgi:hypothetical protein